MNLRNKLAFFIALNSYVELITRGTSPLNLPDAIANSLSYVKAFGGTYQGVPAGYTILDSVSNRTLSTCDVNTGIYVDVDDVEIEIQVSAKTGSWYIFQSQKTQSSTIWGISGANSGAKISFNWGGLVLQSNITRTSGNTYYVKATAKNGNATLYVKDITNNVEDTVTDTYDYGSGPTSWFGIFGTERNPSLAAGNAVYFAKMSVGGKQVLDAIPAQRQSDSVNGFYNKINGQFLIPEELTALNAGTPIVSTPTAPIDITCNNGVLKVRHQSGLPLGYTLVESIGFTGAQYINTGLAINNNTRVLFDVKRSTSSAQSNYPWLGGTRDYVNNTNINKKTLEFSKSDSTRMYLQYATSGEITIFVPDTTNRHIYDFNKNKLYIDENLIYTATQGTFTGSATFLIGTVYLQGSVSTASMFYGDVYGFKLWQDGTNLSMDLIPAKRNSDNAIGMYDLVSGQFLTNQGTGDFVAGNPVDDLEIYTDGTVETIKDSLNNTATAEMLLKVGDYQDVQSIIDGVVTRNIGIKVLDSSLVWTYDRTHGRVNATIPNLWGSTVARTVPGLCTHFKWLSNQESISSITAGQCYSAGANRIFLHISQTSAAAFAAWLDAQRDAGTPVIIVFPLENATTESVAGQTLQVAQGDNTLSIIQASMPGLELEAQYKKRK